MLILLLWATLTVHLRGRGLMESCPKTVLFLKLKTSKASSAAIIIIPQAAPRSNVRPPKNVGDLNFPELVFISTSLVPNGLVNVL